MKYIYLILFALCSSAYGQSKFDTDLRKSLDLIYQMRFDDASKSIKDFYNSYPDSTARLLLKAYYTRWRNLPLTEDNRDIYDHYILILDSAQNESKLMLAKNKNDPRQSYYNMASHIMKAELYATNGHMIKASLEGKNAFTYIKKGFEWCATYPEFLTTTGLYNYYIEYYREKGFFYQSLLWPFSKGSKKEGLEYLKKASHSAFFTKIEALFYLAHLNFKMEINPQVSLKYIKKLVENYPENEVFRDLHIEILIDLNMYNEANTSLKKFKPELSHYLKPRLELYQGILHYNLSKDINKAKNQINKSIQSLKSLEIDQDHYLSLAYYHLGLIENQIGNYDLSKKAFSDAENYAKYPYIIEKLTEIQ